MKESNTSKWKDKEWKREYGKRWREQQKLKLAVGAGAVSPEAAQQIEGQQTMSKWAIRQAEKRAKEEAAKPRVLGLEACPFCKGAFFRKIEDKYEPIKMDQCVACDVRFYYYKGARVQ